VIHIKKKDLKNYKIIALLNMVVDFCFRMLSFRREGGEPPLRKEEAPRSAPTGKCSLANKRAIFPFYL
jgi:hypothetical protein